MFDKVKEWEHFVDTSVGKTFDLKISVLYNVLLDLCIEYNSTLIVTSDEYLSRQTNMKLNTLKGHLTRLLDTNVVSLTEKNLGRGVYEFNVTLPSTIN